MCAWSGGGDHRGGRGPGGAVPAAGGGGRGVSGVRSVEAALEIQTAYVKSSYEGFVAEATKLGEMYADLAKGAYKPYEAPVAKASAAAKAAVAA